MEKDYFSILLKIEQSQHVHQKSISIPQVYPFGCPDSFPAFWLFRSVHATLFGSNSATLKDTAMIDYSGQADPSFW